MKNVPDLAEYMSTCELCVSYFTSVLLGGVWLCQVQKQIEGKESPLREGRWKLWKVRLSVCLVLSVLSVCLSCPSVCLVLSVCVCLVRLSVCRVLSVCLSAVSCPSVDMFCLFCLCCVSLSILLMFLNYGYFLVCIVLTNCVSS